MAILVRSLVRTLLFAGLFFLSMRYIYTALLFFPPWNQHYSFTVSALLGFHDIELFDAIFGFGLSLTMACIGYTLAMKIWRRCRVRRKNTAGP